MLDKWQQLNSNSWVDIVSRHNTRSTEKAATGGGERKRKGNFSLRMGLFETDLGKNQNLDLRGNFWRHDSPTCLNVFPFPEQMN